MTIRTKLRIAALLPIGVALIFCWMFWQTSQHVRNAQETAHFTNTVIKGMLELNILTYEYLAHRENRPRRQWHTKHRALQRLLDRVMGSAPETHRTFERLRRYHARIARLFSDIVASHASHASHRTDPAVAAEWQERLVGEMLVQSHALVSETEQLAQASRAELVTMQKQTTTLLMVVSGALLAVMSIVLFSVSTSIAKTHETLRDTTEELTRANTELARSNQELDAFAYVASHDLKAPLRAIDNLAQWIAEDTYDLLPEAAHSDLQLLRQRARRMEALLDELLQYARAGRVTAPAEVVDTGILVQDIVHLLEPPDGITVHVATPMPTLVTPKAPLDLVFRNLIGNAIKHHKPSGGHITVSARDAGPAMEFRVSDDGPGIAPEFHTQVFQMFQTLKPRDQVEGSGMGLALVKKTVETCGGTLKLESAEGRGAMFSFTWGKATIGTTNGGGAKRWRKQTTSTSC